VLGKALTNAVSSYNKTIGSLEGRVLVSARKLNQLGVVDGELNAPTPVEETVRALSAADLIPDPGPELVAGPGAARTDPTAPQLVSGPRAMGAAS
jgi:DNA anti-recombination protein RmuC